MWWFSLLTSNCLVQVSIKLNTIPRFQLSCVCCIYLHILNKATDWMKFVCFWFIGAMDVALGSAAAGVFTNSDWLWNHLNQVQFDSFLGVPFLFHFLITFSDFWSVCKIIFVIEQWVAFRPVLWPEIECGGCLFTSITPGKSQSPSWQTSTTLENTAGMQSKLEMDPFALVNNAPVCRYVRMNNKKTKWNALLKIENGLLSNSPPFICLNDFHTRNIQTECICCHCFRSLSIAFVAVDRSGGACTAAAFLKEFVTAPHWAHLDIAGVMSNKEEVPYLRKGMSGRPTRTLVEFAARLSKDV